MKFQHLILVTAALSLPIAGLCETFCEFGWSERNTETPVGFPTVEHVLTYGARLGLSNSPEGATYDNSNLSGGCNNYLNITGYMGRYASSTNTTIDFYSVDHKQYRRSNPSIPCNLVGSDSNAPPVIDPANKWIRGQWIACVNHNPTTSPPHFQTKIRSLETQGQAHLLKVASGTNHPLRTPYTFLREKNILKRLTG